MDLKAFNHLLRKITSLTPSENSDGKMSSLERDLLLSYIRELYEKALDVNHVVAVNTPKAALAHAPSPVHQETIPQEVAPIIQPLDAKVVVPTPAIEKVNVEVPTYIPSVVDEPVVEYLAPASPMIMETKPAPTVAVATVVAEPIREQKAYTHTMTLSPELEELFAEDKVTELSDRLALTHVKDLTKSMGINERVFTQQELFKNDANALSEVLQRLNNCQNFDEAKHYLLENVIDTYQWTSDSKLKKAATFVKLVRRRFS